MSPLAQEDGGRMTAIGRLVPVTAITDGRQSEAAADIARGARRLLWSLGLTTLTELALPNGRRADIVGLSASGDIWIAEIKSCIEDFRSDRKWPDYREFCDRLLFAVAPSFPVEILPQDAGLILADRYGGTVVRDAPDQRIATARRKSMILRIASAGLARLHACEDPDLRVEGNPAA